MVSSWPQVLSALLARPPDHEAWFIEVMMNSLMGRVHLGKCPGSSLPHVRRLRHGAASEGLHEDGTTIYPISVSSLLHDA